VTVLPPAADDVLSPLRNLVDDLAQEVGSAAVDAEQGVALKQKIFLLHRSVEQHANAITGLQSEVRALVESWKARFSAGVASMTPLSNAVIPSSPTPAVTNVARNAPPSAETRATLAAPSREVIVGAPAPVAPAPAAPEVSAPAVVRQAAPALVVELPPASPRSTATPRAAVVSPSSGQPRIIDELNASTFIERGWSRIATGDFVGAEESLDKALALNPGDPYAETLLAWAFIGQQKSDSALALLDQVLTRVPDYALALINLGFVEFRRRRFSQATEHLNRAIALDSDRKATLYGHYYLGLVHCEEQRYAESIGALLRAIELGPNLIEARFELGRVLWFANRTDDAIAAWRKGAEVNKFNPWSARCRDMLATIADGGAPSRVA
jgi:tetratricopeptide (TPR) repeat protein